MHYHLHASITAVRFFSIGRAITEHREGEFSFAPTLFSGSLCRSRSTCMTYTCLPVQGCAGSAGWSTDSTDSASSASSAGKSASRFQHYLHYITLWVSTHYYQRVQDASNLCKKYCCPLKPFWYYRSRIAPIARIFLLVQRALAPRRWRILRILWALHAHFAIGP